MSDAVITRLRALLGSAGVEREADGLPRATPDSSESFAQVCHVASDEGWRIRLEGQGTWLAADAPADLALSTRALDQVVSVSPADLVATVQAGAPLDEVRRRLADQGMWLALDPPGRPDRSVGSILATATSGPLRHGFGGFGVITEVHLRLRALPRADVTLTARGPRDRLAAAARAVIAEGLSPSALELFSPALAAEAEWMLAARLTGTDSAVAGEARRLSAAGDVTWQQLRADRSAAYWSLTARAALAGPITLRLGVLPDGLEETIDMVGHDLDEGLVSAGGMGGLRWTGTTTAERLRALRRAMATREIPMTIERAPWELRREVGHFGAYREGVGQLVSKLREAFDPKGTLQVALEGA